VTNLKDAFLSDVRKSNAVLYNTVIVQAQRMDVGADRIVMTFSAAQKIGPTFEKYRAQMEAAATRLAGRKITVLAEMAEHAASPGDEAKRQQEEQRKNALREQALGDAGVQALLDVFPAAEIRDVEEA
jgi:hypothetical protein